MDTITKPVLSDEQQLAHDALVAYATGKDATYAMMLMKGYAGTGKTFTITEVIKTLKTFGLKNDDDIFFGNEQSYPLDIAVTAPTHKAIRVLRKFSTFRTEVEFATIHSLLGLREDVDDKTGKVKYVQSNDPNARRIEDYDVIILDEASMLNDELFHLMLPYTTMGKKIIFLGDPVQIPPVGHKDAIPFKEDMQKKYNIGEVELSTIRRQALDNPILAYATKIRQEYKTSAQFMVATHLTGSPDYSNGIICMESDEQPVKEILKTFFCTEEFKENPDYMKIIAWRNETVNGYNKVVRELIYRKEIETRQFLDPLPYIMEGEKLIVDKPVILPNGKILLTTNEEIKVEFYEIKNDIIEYYTAEKVDGTWITAYNREHFKFYDTTVSYVNHRGDKIECNIRILHEDNWKKMHTLTESIKAAALGQPFGNPLRNKLWKSYYKTERLFAQVKYNYAITGHKSQLGSYHVN